METAHITGKYVEPGAVERRDYQVGLAEQAIRENCIVVLPTGLGKTAVALQVISHYLDEGRGALFLAPTRVLVNQHRQFLGRALTISDITLVTGEDTVPRRKKAWGGSVICATPEITRNDIARGMVPLEQFGLVVFDEAHRAVGDYAYSAIARAVGENSRMIGMTATLPSEREKADEIMGTLLSKSIAQRTEDDPDVKPYVQETETEWIKVELPPEMKEIQKLLKMALDERYAALKRCGYDLGSNRSLSALLRLRMVVLSGNRRAAKPLFTAIRITYALNIFEAHGVTPFLKFCERTVKKKGAGVAELFEEDRNFTGAMARAKAAQAAGMEHPKIPKLEEAVRGAKGKALVFTSYRDSVDLIHSKLQAAGINSGILIGKAGEKGLKQKKQVETVAKFRDGGYDVLVSTRVGEEGLDISEVNLVVFYDNVPSSIRYVQRRGRTGRKDAGKLVVLMAKGTIDEAYYWIGRRKITAARGMGDRMNKSLAAGGPAPKAAPKKGLEGYF
uniref:ATP-dependent RNA helicase n=1 Tax=Cenarchaeum symbiosum (strain A) TaxID=414004 RepID=O74048_CENSY|nr:ATP-dependent RNA helicase [Cenarchaeum symbiosum]